MKVNVPEMSCQHCVGRITKALNEVGIKDVQCDVDSKDVTFELGDVTEDTAIQAIEDAGYPVNR